MRNAIALALLLAAAAAAAEIKLGKPLRLKEPVPISALLARPGQYTGKSVQVKGRITEVCQAMGCWMNLVDESGKSVRIKVDEGEVQFPKDAAGKTAIAEGRFTKIELTREQAIAAARHEAQENNKQFDPARVKGPATIYQIQGEAAVIF